MNVIAGTYGGRTIPFSNRKFNNADITPQKLKGALFSILGEDLTGKSFLDLYACSGQMGIEAVSRGASFVLFNELNKKRYIFIKNLVEEWGCDTITRVLSMPAGRCMRYASNQDYVFDIIFCDPPYEKSREKPVRYKMILREISETRILKPDGIVVVQHFDKSIVPEKAGDLKLVTNRKYGSNSLSEYILQK